MVVTVAGIGLVDDMPGTTHLVNVGGRVDSVKGTAIVGDNCGSPGLGDAIGV